jgi:hypothetical protein
MRIVDTVLAQACIRPGRRLTMMQHEITLAYSKIACLRSSTLFGSRVFTKQQGSLRARTSDIWSTMSLRARLGVAGCSSEFLREGRWGACS